MSQRDTTKVHDPEVAALIALARHGVPLDVQELLVRGNPSMVVPPGALSAALRAASEAQNGRE